MPTFSFIIPVKSGGVVKALDALRQLYVQGYQFEILIAEGTKPSHQRNLAAQQSQGEILYFIDDDSLVTPDCLSLCAEALEDLSVAVVGGPSLTPRDDSRIQRLFGYALTSPFGAGGVRNRYRSFGQPRMTSEKELILCNLAIRRDVFLATGGMDERLYPNEENEFLDRICDAGYKLMHVPSMWVIRSQRASLKAFLRQMFNYGRGRAQQTIIAGPRSLMNFIPLAFIVYLALLPFVIESTLSLIPLTAYIALDLMFSCVALLSSGNPAALLLFFLFPLMHCANGTGLLYGFLGRNPRPISTEGIVVKHIKNLDQTTW